MAENNITPNQTNEDLTSTPKKSKGMTIIHLFTLLLLILVNIDCVLI